MDIKPKNILHVFSTLSVGGPQRRFADYAHHTQAKHKHHVYAMDGQYQALDLIMGMAALFDGRQVIPKGNTLSAILACRKQLKALNPDLLVTYNWGATEWALANSIFPICPTIHIQDGFGEDEQTGEIPARRLMRAFSYRNCAKVIVPSHTLENQVRAGWSVQEKRLMFIPNGIDIERFSHSADSALKQSCGIKNSHKVIGTVAALRPEKNIGRLIEAFSLIEDKHPDSQLVIVGDGVGMPALKMLAERVCKQGNVIFTGNLKDPEYILPAFNVFALSSDTEQMPLSVLEAMTCGLPIVSTDVGDVKEMVADENKPFVADKNAKTLATKLDDLLTHPLKIQTIGQENRKKAKANYSAAQMIEAYDKVFTNPHI